MIEVNLPDVAESGWEVGLDGAAEEVDGFEGCHCRLDFLLFFSWGFSLILFSELSSDGFLMAKPTRMSGIVFLFLFPFVNFDFSLEM